MIYYSKDSEDGKLVNVSLIPEKDNLELTPVGGPGKEFWVFGKNYENESRDNTGESTYERAAWRIELSPKNPEPENYFLNVMQVMGKNTQKLDVIKIDGENVIGVQLSDRVVIVSKNFEKLNTTFGFSLTGKGNVKILITDLLRGSWQVMKNDQLVIPEANVELIDGLLYFEGTNGKYTIIKL